MKCRNKLPNVPHEWFMIGKIDMNPLPATTAEIIKTRVLPAEIWTLLYLAQRTNSILKQR